jgi:hypothetical protein
VEPRRFDTVAKMLTVSGSRRRLLSGLLAAALGTGAIPAAASSTCRTVGRTCREDADCCSHYCALDVRLRRRLCACPAGTKPCGGNCIPASSCCFGECDGADYCVQRTEDGSSFCATYGICFFPTGRSCDLGCVGHPCDESTGHCVICLADADCKAGQVCVEGLASCPKACVSSP